MRMYVHFISLRAPQSRFKRGWLRGCPVFLAFFARGLGGLFPRPHAVLIPSQLTQSTNAERVMPLGQPYPSVITHQVAVIVIRHCKPQRPKQKNLPSGRLQQVRAADHLSNPHSGIVDHDGKLICGNIIPPPDNEVPEILACDHALLPQMQICEADLFPVRHSKPPVHAFQLGPCSDGRLGRPAKAKPSGSGDGPAGSGIQRLIIPLIRSPSRLRHILPRASTRIDHSQIPQLLPCCEIVRPPLALRVRRTRPAAIRPLGPLNPQPVKVVIHRLNEFGPAALRIQVFIAKNQLPMMFCRTLRRDPECARVT